MSDGRAVLSRDDDSGVARLTFDNPERRNSCSPDMCRAMRAHLDQLADDGDVKVVHLRGASGVFSTGRPHFDLAEPT